MNHSIALGNDLQIVRAGLEARLLMMDSPCPLQALHQGPAMLKMCPLSLVVYIYIYIYI